MYLSPTLLAIALASSMSAPCSSGILKLITDANPLFFNSGSACAGVAPAQATVASTRV